MIPDSYHTWRHCLSTVYKIPLTQKYCNERIATLQDLNDDGTRVLVAFYGEEHRQRLLNWFAEARRHPLAAGASEPTAQQP